MSAIHDGGPAFPTTPEMMGYLPGTLGAGTGCGPGMSLRAWFAGQALQGLAVLAVYKQPASTVEQIIHVHEDLAKAAIAVADALISELHKSNP